jgi:hypothetical protein
LVANRIFLTFLGKKMDLAKIIGELRQELQCLEAAIASMEELARVQNVPILALKPAPQGPEVDPDDPPPGKVRRGRARKSEPGVEETPLQPDVEDPAAIKGPPEPAK